MHLTFKQKFLQQKNLQQTLYGKFGYNIQSMNQIVQKKKKVDNYPVTANIKLRKVTPSLYRNQKIDQIQKQIQDLHKDRKRRQQQNKLNKNPQNLNKFIDQMNHIIDQYNYLVDHKHIKQKGTDQARKMLNIKPKTQAQKAVEQIAQLKQLLIHANIKQQFQLNKKINNLYRVFKDKIDQPDVVPRKKIISKDQIIQNSQGSNFRVMSRTYQESNGVSPRPMSKIQKLKNQKLERNRLNATMNFSLYDVKAGQQKSQGFLNTSLNEGHLRKIKSQVENNQVGRKRIGSIDQAVSIRLSPQKIRIEKDLKRKKQQETQKDLIQPYVSKDFIENGKKMDIKIKNNNDALELWKGRIAQAVLVPQQQENPSYTKQKKPSKYQRPYYDSDYQRNTKQINDYELNLKQHVLYIQNKKIFKHQTVQSLKKKNKQQQNILSGLLSKRNCKYLRPWGTKILVKYNAQKQAKQMLGLSPKKDPKQKQQAMSKSQQNIHGKGLSQKLQQKLKIPLNLTVKQNQQEAQIDWDKQIDQEYYWTMCKNQKINLLLKGKRR